MNHRILQMLTRYEILRQKRQTSPWFRREGIAVVAISGLLIFYAFFIFTTTRISPGIMDSPEPVLWWTQCAVWIIQFITISRGILAGLNAAREGDSATWDILVLSRVTPWQLFISKWRAALSRTGGYLVALGFTRLMILVIGFTSFTMLMTAERLRYAIWCIDTQCAGIGTIYTYAQADQAAHLLILAAIFAVLFSLLEVLTSTALGLMVGMISQRLPFPFMFGLIIRFMVPLLSFMKIMQYYPSGLINSIYYLWNPSTTFALVDGGTAALLRWLEPPVIVQNRLPSNWIDIGLGIAVPTAILVISVLITLWAIRRRGALWGEIKSQLARTAGQRDGVRQS